MPNPAEMKNFLHAFTHCMRCKQPKTFSLCPLEWIAHTRGTFSLLLLYETSTDGAVALLVLATPMSVSKNRIGFAISLNTKYGPLRIELADSLETFRSGAFCFLGAFRFLEISIFVNSSWKIEPGVVASTLFLTCITITPHFEGSNGSLTSP